MLRAALYARFSTDQQSAASTADQLRICHEAAERMGAEVVGEFEDAAISGSAIGNRPGLQALLRLAKARGCDVVVAEHTDRLSRAGGDTWHIYDDLKAYGVRYVTVNQGEITTMHVGLSGTMSAMMIEEGARKTRRGLEGVVRSGRSAGGMAYGYRSPLAYDPAGERVRGLREIDETEAAVVRRIFRHYAAGGSPLALVDAMNREGVPGPRGGPWVASTISGSPKRGLGILRNEIYRGVRVWGRLTFIKDRATGNRRPAPGTGSVQRLDVPELRIIDESLWRQVQDRLAENAVGPMGERRGQHRPSRLLSGLIRCGCCGAPMTVGGSGGHLRCAKRSSQGSATCTNNRYPPYDRIEAKVLAGIEANLLHPLAVAEAVKAFHVVLKGERRSAAQRQAPAVAELADVERRAARLVREVEDGMPWAAVKDRHAHLTARAEVLRAMIGARPAEVVPLRPNIADDYRAFVSDLRANLVHGGEAAEAVRAIVEEVRFLPGQKKGAFDLEVTADLAPVLGVNASGPELVHGAGSGSRFIRSHRFPVTFRLAG